MLIAAKASEGRQSGAVLRIKSITGGLLLTVASVSSTAAADTSVFSPEARESGRLAANAMREVAETCFSVTRLTLSAFEAKSTGIEKDALVAHAKNETRVSSLHIRAIDLGFRMERVSDPRLSEWFLDCLKRGERDIGRILSQ